MIYYVLFGLFLHFQYLWVPKSATYDMIWSFTPSGCGLSIVYCIPGRDLEITLDSVPLGWSLGVTTAPGGTSVR